jgi:putative heme-binding domain-containing protein
MRYFPLLALFLTPLSALAQRDAKVPDPDPELERKTFIVPDGFEVNLFAADPMLAKPIQMNFDPQGRLWVASSEVYPQIKPGQVANDRILILEDADGDGKAEKTTIFADGLLIPTGVAPGDGGAYVADSTDLVHFSDPDPKTGKARKKRIVLSGFGTEDTHHIIHTFRWGLDGRLYISQSIYIHSHIETPHGVRRLNAGGIWQFRPETVELDIFARGWVNSWGTQFDRWGQTFATDGAGGEGINFVVPGAYYATAHGAARILQGLNPGSPKHCGLAVASGRHLPPEYQGSLITNDFRGHRVCRFELKDDGSGFLAQEKQELIKSNHPAFRPVDVAMGPDGAIYVADWYNPIIQHGEVDFRDPRRDKTHGRIWRITAKGRPLVERPKLVGASVPELLENLKAPEDWTRQMARQVLKERGQAAVLPELGKWLVRLDPSDQEIEHQALEALWVCQSLDTPDAKLLETVLNAKDPRGRAAACRIVGAWAARLADPIALLASRVVDDHPRVRLEAVRALAKVPTSKAAVLAAQALDKPVDRWLDYAIWLTLRELAPHWLEEVKAGKLDFNGNPRHLIFALQSAGTQDVAKPLAKMLKPDLPFAREVEVLHALARYGGTDELGTVIHRAYRLRDHDRMDQRWLGTIMAAVAESIRTRKVPFDAIDEMTLSTFLTSPDRLARRASLDVIGLWKVDHLRSDVEGFFTSNPLRRVLPQQEASLEELHSAAQALVRLGGEKSRRFLIEAYRGGFLKHSRHAAVVALVDLDLQTAASLAVDYLTNPNPDTLPDLVRAFCQKKGAAGELARALRGKRIPADPARIAVRAAQADGQPDKALITALTKAGGLTAVKRTLVGKDLEQFVADVTKLGDPARGEAIYRRAELTCLKCHAVAGAGGQVGPDLSSVGASAPVDYLVDSLLVPNSKIKEGFNTLTVTDLDGRTVTGIKVRESKELVVLRDHEDREVVIPVADIDSRKDGLSLMPEGLTDSLTRQELLDLTRFLAELGKGPYAATPGRVVRRWQVLQPTREALTVLNRDRLAAAAAPGNSLTWAPAYSLVNGELPVDVAPVLRWRKDAPSTSVVRFQLDVTAAGKVQLGFRDPAGLSAWVDGNPIEVGVWSEVELPVGVRTITVAIDRDRRQGPLRVELGEVKGSPARVRIVGGK